MMNSAAAEFNLASPSVGVKSLVPDARQRRLAQIQIRGPARSVGARLVIEPAARDGRGNLEPCGHDGNRRDDRQ